MSRVDLGVKIDNVVTFGMSPGLNGYEPRAVEAFFERARAGAGAAFPAPPAWRWRVVPLLAGNNWGNDVSVEGFKRGPDTDAEARYNEISAGYFRTLGVPLMSGREFTAADTATAPEGRHRQ